MAGAQADSELETRHGRVNTAHIVDPVCTSIPTPLLSAIESYIAEKIHRFLHRAQACRVVPLPLCTLSYPLGVSSLRAMHVHLDFYRPQWPIPKRLLLESPSHRFPTPKNTDAH